jgi:uncharacterized protein
MPHRRDLLLGAAASAAAMALAGCAGRPPSVTARRGPRLWRVARGAGEVVLFGFGDARDQSWLSPALQSAQASAQELWLETAGQDAQPPPSADSFARINLASNLEGLTLFDVIEPQLVTPLRARLAELGISENAVLSQKPWRVFYAINGAWWQAHPPAVPATPVDAELERRAREKAMPIHYEFPTFVEFAEFMGGMSHAAQSQYVAWLLATQDDRAAGRVGNPYAWITGEEPQAALARMARFPELFAVMQGQRNRWWADRIGQLLDGGRKALVAVGQLHVAGQTGIPALLRARGESVSAFT